MQTFKGSSVKFKKKRKIFLLIDFLFRFLVFYVTFSNISAISWRQVLEVEEAAVPERTTDHGQATGKLYHLRLRIECTFFVIYKAGHVLV